MNAFITSGRRVSVLHEGLFARKESRSSGYRKVRPFRMGRSASLFNTCDANGRYNNGRNFVRVPSSS
jgi:hypothetical protein